MTTPKRVRLEDQHYGLGKDGRVEGHFDKVSVAPGETIQLEIPLVNGELPDSITLHTDKGEQTIDLRPYKKPRQ
jgi:hypothetical protein